MIRWPRLSDLQRYPRLLQDVSREALWKLSGLREQRPRLTWELDRLKQARCVVYWPTHYQWPPAQKWVEPLRYGMRRLVRVESADIPQPYHGVVVLRLAVDGREMSVAVDYSDRPQVNDLCVEAVSAYFKMQYRREGYPWPHVVPGGFVTGDSLLYDAQSYLRAQRDSQEFAFDVYGRFSLDFASEIRRRVVEMLSGQSRFRYEGGVARIRYSRYLREIARSKICIDLPGNGDFCFRLVDYLGVGACIISVRPGNEMHVPLVDGEHLVYAKEDLSDLIDLCERYLEDDSERERLCRNAREFFDRYLHRDQLAAYYLHRCFAQLESAASNSP